MKKSKIFLTAMAALVLSLGMVMSSCAIFGGQKRDVDTTITFDATTLRNVMRVSDDGIEKGWLAVSRDGQKLLYCEQPVNFDLSSNTRNLSSRIMYLRNASVFAKTPLVESFSFAPAWYDDGTNFVYVRLDDNGNTQLVKSAISGGGRTFITRNPIGVYNGRGYDNRPSIRNGIIVCDTRINGAQQIVSLRDNGTEVTVLGSGSFPSWHPNKNKLVFINEGGIWEMDTETTQKTQIYPISANDRNAGISCTSPSFSNDGRHIIFAKTVKIGSSLYWHLFRMDADGNNLTELTGGSVDAISPAYGVGNQIFFLSNAGQKWEIWSALITME